MLMTDVSMLSYSQFTVYNTCPGEESLADALPPNVCDPTQT